MFNGGVGALLTQKLNKVGPSTEPWGTPKRTIIFFRERVSGFWHVLHVHLGPGFDSMPALMSKIRSSTVRFFALEPTLEQSNANGRSAGPPAGQSPLLRQKRASTVFPWSKCVLFYHFLNFLNQFFNFRQHGSWYDLLFEILGGKIFISASVMIKFFFNARVTVLK